MKARFKRFLDHLNFTSTERIALLALVGAFVAGLGITLFQRDATPGPGFDYSAADAEFAMKSAATPAVTARFGPPDSNGAARGARARKADRKSGPMVPIDINRAGKRELMGLPGIGDVIAGRILLYRAEHGAFKSLRDLLKVKGIGKKKLEHIAPYCFVEK